MQNALCSVLFCLPIAGGCATLGAGGSSKAATQSVIREIASMGLRCVLQFIKSSENWKRHKKIKFSGYAKGTSEWNTHFNAFVL